MDGIFALMVEHKARRVEFKRRASDRGLYARYFSRGSVKTVQIEPLGEAYLERKYGYVDGLRVEHAELTKLFDTGWAHTKGKRQKPAKHPTSRRRHPAGKAYAEPLRALQPLRLGVADALQRLQGDDRIIAR